MNPRRNARDYERLPQHSEAHLTWALVTMMTRRLTRENAGATMWTKRPAAGWGLITELDAHDAAWHARIPGIRPAG